MGELDERFDLIDDVARQTGLSNLLRACKLDQRREDRYCLVRATRGDLEQAEGRCRKVQRRRALRLSAELECQLRRRTHFAASVRVRHRLYRERVGDERFLPALLGDVSRGCGIRFRAIKLAQQDVRLGEHDVHVREGSFIAELPPLLGELLACLSDRTGSSHHIRATAAANFG